jgi:hypothetical protein
MFVSWLGINRTYFHKSIEQSACHQIPCQDDIDLQALTAVAKLFDSVCDKDTDIKCKNNFTIFGHR